MEWPIIWLSDRGEMFLTFVADSVSAAVCGLLPGTAGSPGPGDASDRGAHIEDVWSVRSR